MEKEDGHKEKEILAQSSRHRRVQTRRADSPSSQAAESFITKEDLSQFLSIKPYLSTKAQAIVDLLDEMVRSGGRLEPASLTRLLGLVGGDNANLSALSSLAGLAGSGGKLDPSTLLPLLGALGRTTGQEKGK